MTTAILIAGVLLASPVVAQPVTVSYGDLNLASAAGMTKLEHRIAGAARRTCGAGSDVRSLSELAAFEACRRETTAAAMARVRAQTTIVLAAR